MTRVIHTADTHIGYRQYHSPERRRDFLAAFEQVVADAVEEDVDAVVHAGDLFHDRRPDLPDLLGTIGALGELAEADIPFLAVVGNHEDKREAQWLDLFERLDLATHLDASGTTVGSVTFYGLDYVPRSRRDDVDLSFADPEGEYTALVAHGLFAPLAPAVAGDRWDTEALLADADRAFDAILLGDDHHPDTARVGDTWVTYPGSTERVSASEEGDRGYNVVAFEDEVDVARRGLPTREFVFVDVELRDGEGVERVRERVREHDLEGAVVYVRVDGAGEPFAPAAVEEFAADHGALVARVNDRRALETRDADLDVSFADPDEAVRERVRELGLSDAARELDETVRASGLADANVRDAVRDRVEDLLEENPDTFDPAGDDERQEAGDDVGTAEADTVGAGEDAVGAGEDAVGAGEDAVGAGEDAVGAGDDAEAAVDDAEAAVDDAEGADDGASAAAAPAAVDADDPGAGTAGEDEDGGPTDAEASAGADEEASEPDGDDSSADGAGGDGQASVEDFL